MHELSARIYFRDVDWSNVPAEPGVYVIYDLEEVVYVGMAGRNGRGSLRCRLRDHASGQIVNMFAQYLFLARVQFLPEERIVHPRDGKTACKDYIRARCAFHYRVATNAAMARRSLAVDGLFLLHTIGKNFSGMPIDPWTERYIFPNGDLPSQTELSAAIEPYFLVEDWHNFGADYDRTLMAWHQRFEAARPELRKRHGERFCRMWSYYLLSCPGSFRARDNQLWQIVLSPGGLAGGYRRPE